MCSTTKQRQLFEAFAIAQKYGFQHVSPDELLLLSIWRATSSEGRETIIKNAREIMISSPWAK